jgi:hypothetical protein
MKQLTEKQIRSISAESLVDVRTVRRYLVGEKVRNTSELRIVEAAKVLKIKVK